MQGVEQVELVDELRCFVVPLTLSRPARLWRLPVETVTLSEEGFERVYQSSTVLPSWGLPLRPGEPQEIELALAIESWPRPGR